MTQLDRRSFLKGVLGTGAFVIGARLDAPGLLLAKEAEGPLKPSLWLSIAADGKVTIWTHRSEMGTGIRTSLPMVVADELEADWSKVSIAQAIGDRRYGSQNTDGSRSIRRFYEPMRRAGAAARMLLEQAAAETWGVPAEKCKAKLHKVHGPGGKTLGFGDLVAKAKTLTPPRGNALKFKPKAERRYVGKESVRFYDAADIVSGKAQYGADVKLPGMKIAVIWRVPVLGGVIESFDDSETKKVKGVEQVVQLPAWKGAPAFNALGGIAVVAKSTWAAIEGRKKLKVKWKPGPHGSFDTDDYFKQLVKTVNAPGKPVRKLGDVDDAMGKAASKHAADYTVPFLAHASMEPPCALVQIKDGKVEAWAPTQNPQAAQSMLCMALRKRRSDVVVNVTLLGGGFGRKSKPDYVVEAGLLAKQLGIPIRVQWTREDDIRWDYYHSGAAVRLEAALDKDGMPQAWLGRSAFPPIPSTFNPRAQTGSDMELHLGFTDMPYDIPNIRLEVGNAKGHVRIGWLRSVCHIFHAFADSSFVDELAAKAKMDRLAYLKKLIGKARNVELPGVKYPNQGEPISKHPIDTGRLLGALETVAKKAGWGKKLPKGRGQGIAVHRGFLSYVAVCVEVEVSKGGRVSIPRVDIAIDCGLVVNPDRVRAQMEGSVVFGASLAMTGEISASDGAIEQSNFHDYRVARMSDAPKVINVHLIDSEKAPTGVGEPGVPPFAPALTNAIFAATGKRIRNLPIKAHDLSWK